MNVINTALTTAPHITLTNVTMYDVKSIGYGMTDDGESVFIPSWAMEALDFDESQIGVGFRSQLRPPSDNPTGKSYRMVSLPFQLDSDTVPHQAEIVELFNAIIKATPSMDDDLRFDIKYLLSRMGAK